MYDALELEAGKLGHRYLGLLDDIQQRRVQIAALERFESQRPQEVGGGQGGGPFASRSGDPHDGGLRAAVGEFGLPDDLSAPFS